MNTLTVTYGDVSITVRKARVIDNLNLTRLAVKCASWTLDDAALDALVMEWLHIATRTESVENVDYVLPTITDTEDEVKAKFDSFLELDGDLVERWTDAIQKANKPVNAAKFAPVASMEAIAPNS